MPKQMPPEALLDLRRRLDILAPRSPERRAFVERYRTFCLTVPAVTNSAFTLGNALEDLLSGPWGGAEASIEWGASGV